MNKKILLTMFLALMVLFLVNAIEASDVNMTDSISVSTSDNSTIQIEESNDMESGDSNTLSTDDEDDSLKEGKTPTELTSNSTSIYYKGSYQVTLKDSDSNSSLANKEVNFIINNVNYTAVTDENGTASFNLNLAPGKYTAIAYFAGDDGYGASNNMTITLTILSTIKASDITKYYKGSTQYAATFYDSQGNALTNTNVVITVNGKSYTKKTDKNGKVSMAVNLNPGTYMIVATDPLTGYKLTTTYKILSTISASATSKVVGDNKKFTAKFLKSNGKALSKAYIKFKLKGKTYKVKTNAYGKASLSLKNLKKGTYSVVCYNKDGLTKTYKIKVYYRVSTKFTTNTYNFLKSGTKKIKVTLVNGFGYAPTSGKIVKITINKKTYYKKTNSKGIVYLKLPSLKKGIYTVKYKFSGTTHYKASSASSKVAILPSKNVALTVKSTKTFGYGAGTPFKVAVTSGGVAVLNKQVTLVVNGAKYTKTTNNYGIVSLPINLDIGSYTVSYSIKKDSKVNAKSGSCAIKVVERSPCKLTWKSGTSFAGSTQTIKVQLTDLNGKAISGKTVKLTIKSKTYSATTSSTGYATFKVSAPVGTYTASVNFAGCNDYKPNSTSTSVTITVSNLKKGINEKNTISDLSAYLKSSKNCQVDNSKIKTLVTKLTKGLTSAYDKANAIFEYVRDTLSYSFYYNTKYGAVGTLDAKKGNCVDHTHLLVAMFRTADLPARYVHGKCTFSSGSKYGHVWAQVLIGDTWVCADGTSSKNSLGKIANWNTNSFSLNGIYSSLSF